jgi:hypothetical protein
VSRFVQVCLRAGPHFAIASGCSRLALPLVVPQAKSLAALSGLPHPAGAGSREGTEGAKASEGRRRLVCVSGTTQAGPITPPEVLQQEGGLVRRWEKNGEGYAAGKEGGGFESGEGGDGGVSLHRDEAREVPDAGAGGEAGGGGGGGRWGWEGGSSDIGRAPGAVFSTKHEEWWEMDMGKDSTERNNSAGVAPRSEEGKRVPRSQGAEGGKGDLVWALQAVQSFQGLRAP